MVEEPEVGQRPTECSAFVNIYSAASYISVEYQELNIEEGIYVS